MSKPDARPPQNMKATEGARLAYQNARSYVELAHVSAEKGEYGHAVSLSILASEEAIKAISYVFYRLGFDKAGPLRDLDVFSDEYLNQL